MRRQGIAVQLIEEAEKMFWSKKIEVKLMTLELFVEKENEGAIAFYLKNGWTIKGEIETMKYGICWIRGLVEL